MMQNEIFQFDFKGITLRAVKIDGEPWFVAKDVCEALGMDLYAGTSRWMAGLLATEKVRVGSAQLPQIFCGSRAGTLNLISEPGLYKLVMRSDKPQAREFQDWVTRDVLPAIRKDGGYIMGEEKVVTGEMTEDELLLTAFTLLNGKVDRLRVEKEKLERENGKLEKENGKLTAELTSVTLAEYAAINHVYFTQSEKGRITAAVRKLCATLGVPIGKDTRFVRTHGKEFEAQVNVYRRDVLDRACSSLGVFKDARGSIRPVTGRLQ